MPDGNTYGNIRKANEFVGTDWERFGDARSIGHAVQAGTAGHQPSDCFDIFARLPTRVLNDVVSRRSEDG